MNEIMSRIRELGQIGDWEALEHVVDDLSDEEFDALTGYRFNVCGEVLDLEPLER